MQQLYKLPHLWVIGSWKLICSQTPQEITEPFNSRSMRNTCPFITKLAEKSTKNIKILGFQHEECNVDRAAFISSLSQIICATGRGRKAIGISPFRFRQIRKGEFIDEISQIHSKSNCKRVILSDMPRKICSKKYALVAAHQNVVTAKGRPRSFCISCSWIQIR